MRTTRPTALAALLVTAAVTLALTGCAESSAGARPSRVAEEGPLRLPPPRSGEAATGTAGRSAPVPHTPLPGLGAAASAGQVTLPCRVPCPR
ncbi:hypothetical protein AB0M29_03850 [Streptomyces sp. NPDC051976]|uniref:hypothetical protein n=1 Tax=Streptomyces sp. NPDC051976 TaxID=3154947 RepID=UPI0034232064